MRNLRWLVALGVAAAVLAPSALAGGRAPTVTGNVLVDQDHGLLFSQNKQNEPAITRDPYTGVLIVGANDEIGQPLCTGTTDPLANPCPFDPAVSIDGVYRSTDGGRSWSGAVLPNPPGRTGGGDPSLEYGPARCASGTFSWACGTVVYYSSLGDPYPDAGGEQVLVYRSLDDGATWSSGVSATSTDNKSSFDDHPWLAVDRSSAHFGRVYLFWAVYCNSCAGNGGVKLYVAHSDDEGRTFSPALQVSATSNNSAQGFRETGQIAVSGDGTVEAFWTEFADSKKTPSVQVASISKNGGLTFSAPVSVGAVTDYPVSGTPFDAVDLYNRVPGMSARVDCYPHPAADPSSTRVYVVWCDFSGGHGVVKGAVSADGSHWTALGTIGSVTNRNAFFPQASVAPSGLVSVEFDALTAPPANDLWQTGTQVYDNYYVQSPAGGTSFTAPLRVSTASSNPDGSSYNDLEEQFIGDYTGIVSGPGAAYVVWTDARAAQACAAVDAYRNAVYGGSRTAIPPNPDDACPTGFGNTDTEVAVVNQ